MRIDQALIGARRLYVDTAPMIYYVEQHPDHISRMDAIIEFMQKHGIAGVCSAITLAEVLPVPLRSGDKSLAALYREILLNSTDFTCLPVEVPAAEIAATLRVRYGLKTPDALHLAVAIHTRCEVFLTNDHALSQVRDIRVLLLDELEVV